MVRDAAATRDRVLEFALHVLPQLLGILRGALDGIGDRGAENIFHTESSEDSNAMPVPLDRRNAACIWRVGVPRLQAEDARAA